MGDASLDPVQRIWQLIGMNPPVVGGRGGGGFGGAAATQANTGDYLVTMTVNGQTLKQTFRVERVSGSDEANPQFGEDENHDQSGRYAPAPAKTKSK
jgi:hypothetical protein